MCSVSRIRGTHRVTPPRKGVSRIRGRNWRDCRCERSGGDGLELDFFGDDGGGGYGADTDAIGWGWAGAGGGAEEVLGCGDRTGRVLQAAVVTPGTDIAEDVIFRDGKEGTAHQDADVPVADERIAGERAAGGVDAHVGNTLHIADDDVMREEQAGAAENIKTVPAIRRGRISVEDMTDTAHGKPIALIGNGDIADELIGGGVVVHIESISGVGDGAITADEDLIDIRIDHQASTPKSASAGAREGEPFEFGPEDGACGLNVNDGDGVAARIEHSHIGAVAGIDFDGLVHFDQTVTAGVYLRGLIARVGKRAVAVEVAVAPRPDCDRVSRVCIFNGLADGATGTAGCPASWAVHAIVGDDPGGGVSGGGGDEQRRDGGHENGTGVMIHNWLLSTRIDEDLELFMCQNAASIRETGRRKSEMSCEAELLSVTQSVPGAIFLRTCSSS